MLRDAVDAYLPEFRREAEALMVDTCEVLRATGTTIDQESGEEVVAFETVYTGPCRLRMKANAAATDRSAGEQLVSVTPATFQTPADVDHLRENDRPRILTSRSPGLVGRVVRIDSPWLQTDSVMCRYPCEESSLPDVDEVAP